MRDWLGEILKVRPTWMNGLMLFCLFMTFAYFPLHFFLWPVAAAQDVWFGFVLGGWLAKAGTLAHWAIYAAGAYGFWRMQPWMWPWAAVYAAQVAGAMFVWTILQLNWPRGPLLAPLAAVPFTVLTVLLWNARERFVRGRGSVRQRYGDWAVVTGASSGIGREFARALAREGISCVVSARREDELRRLADELAERFKVEARIVVADLGTEEGVEQLAAATGDLDVAMLINNAGFGYAGRFDKQDGARLANMLRVNCLAPLLLTTRFVPRLLDRGRGAVIFTGSVAGRTPLPLHAVYSATKAFNEFLGKSLWAELLPRGIDVLVLEPGPVDTGFQRVSGELVEDATVPPRAVVDTALAALGRQPVVVHGWGLMAASWFARVLPSSLVLQLTQRTTARLTPREMR